MNEPRHNRNSEKRLREIVAHVQEQLRFVSHAPSVQSQIIPPDLGPIRDEVEARLKEENDEKDEQLRRTREEGVGHAMEY
jgi:histone deacetylase HOS2